LRVADIWACYKQWGDKGAFFLTEPLDNHGWEWRCYMRDPDGYLIEVGQYSEMALERFKNDASEVATQLHPKDASMQSATAFVSRINGASNLMNLGFSCASIALLESSSLGGQS